MVWLPNDTTFLHRPNDMEINNYRSQYKIRKLRAWFTWFIKKKKWTKYKYDIQQQMTTTELQAPDLGQAHTEC